MSTRSEALKLLEELKDICLDYPLEASVLAIAIQSKIFEKLDPELWEESVADAILGLSIALPETFI